MMKRLETPEQTKARAEIRERILKEAMEVLGDGEVFKPTTAPFLTKLRSSSSSSSGDSEYLVSRGQWEVNMELQKNNYFLIFFISCRS